MSDTPKFEVIDRRKMKAEEEKEYAPEKTPTRETPASEPSAGPRLVTTEAVPESPAKISVSSSEKSEPQGAEQEGFGELPPAPSAEESRQQKAAYDASAQRIEDLVRAQNPGMGAQPAVGFDHLVQQLYLSSMIQMGAGTQEGQRPRVDIMGARQTIDMIAVLAEKTKGNLTEIEERTLQTVLFDVRMAFLELTNMISMQSMQAPPPPPTKKR